MSLRGYSYRLVEANRNADSNLIGVQLGRYCIAKDISVIDTAGMFNVSKMTIYQWFIGNAKPHKSKAEQIKRVLTKAKFNNGKD
jgi:transcriptional regulator with XRE-family HTH domain